MMERKEIAPVKIGNRTLFDKRDLDEFIEKAKNKAEPFQTLPQFNTLHYVFPSISQ
jgi:hypothetical protein